MCCGSSPVLFVCTSVTGSLGRPGRRCQRPISSGRNVRCVCMEVDLADCTLLSHCPEWCQPPYVEVLRHSSPWDLRRDAGRSHQSWLWRWLSAIRWRSANENCWPSWTWCSASCLMLTLGMVRYGRRDVASCLSTLLRDTCQTGFGDRYSALQAPPAVTDCTALAGVSVAMHQGPQRPPTTLSGCGGRDSAKIMARRLCPLPLSTQGQTSDSRWRIDWCYHLLSAFANMIEPHSRSISAFASAALCWVRWCIWMHLLTFSSSNHTHLSAGATLSVMATRRQMSQRRLLSSCLIAVCRFLSTWLCIGK